MKIRIQPVAGGHYDFAKFRCDCGRVARIGVGDNNWEELVDEKGRPTKESSVEEKLPSCYGKYTSDDPLCKFGCYWSRACQHKTLVGGISCPIPDDKFPKPKGESK